MSERLRTLGAVLLGLVLATFPFLQYRHGGAHSLRHGGAPHMNHASLYGGLLAMVDDHHLELAWTTDKVEVHVSDAFRRPLAARGGTLRFDTRVEQPLVWEGYRLVARFHGPRGASKPAPAGAGFEEVEVSVVLAGGERLATSFSGSDLAALQVSAARVASSR